MTVHAQTTRREIPTTLLLLVGGVLFVFLFVGGPSGQWPRSAIHLWDLGHVGLFACLGLLALRTRLGRAPAGRQLVSILVGALVLGAITELLQSGFHRNPDMGDLLRDLLGASLALAFDLPGRLPRQPVATQLLRALVLGWLAVTLVPLVTALADESAARRSFPVLGDFESSLESGRWIGGAGYGITDREARRGNRSLEIDLGTSAYSGVALVNFPGDWRTYDTLAFSVMNPEPEPIELVCKIYDRLHPERGYRYEDRFNRRLTFPQGWTDVLIPLDDLRAAPRDREMDLARISHLALFAVGLPEPRTVYLDAVELRP